MVEGARLESVYMFHKHIEGSNPSLSATFLPIFVIEADRRKVSGDGVESANRPDCVCYIN